MVEKITVYQFSKRFEKKLLKSAMARKMSTSRSSLDRLLDPKNESETLYTLKKAAHVVGRKIRLELA